MVAAASVVEVSPEVQTSNPRLVLVLVLVLVPVLVRASVRVLVRA